ncbi:MAG TPA: hypothetical protein PLI74_13035 [Candidatus Kapabacteria bacterium]|jgi:hypothetical protein|nr:hypothetical protein [Candidatus Kapabacteria bacterium]
MILINDQTITDVYNRLADLQEEHVTALMDTMATEQPSVLAYMMANAGEMESPMEAETLMFTGVVLWNCFKEHYPVMPAVNEDMLDDNEQANIELMHRLDELSMQGETDVVQKMMDEYPQPFLLSYALSAISNESYEEDEEEISEEDMISEEAQGAMIILFKTILDSYIAIVQDKE